MQPAVLPTTTTTAGTGKNEVSLECFDCQLKTFKTFCCDNIIANTLLYLITWLKPWTIFKTISTSSFFFLIESQKVKFKAVYDKCNSRNRHSRRKIWNCSDWESDWEHFGTRSHKTRQVRRSWKLLKDNNFQFFVWFRNVPEWFRNDYTVALYCSR